MSPVGTAAADALPASEKVSPAAPNAGTAALATRFFFDACFTRCMVASSECCRKDIHGMKVYAERRGQARFTNIPKCSSALVQIVFIFMNGVAFDPSSRLRCGLQCATDAVPQLSPA